MPCSPERVPPKARAFSKIASMADSTRCHSALSRRSVRIVGCRFPSPAWPKVPINISNFRLIFCMARTISGILLLGTVASSRTTVGFNLASAESALRRASHTLSLSVASFATRMEVAPILRHKDSTLAASSSTWAGWPSTSISSKAAASTGSPARLKSSTARMVKLSKNSSVAGTIRLAIIAATVSEALSIWSNTANMAF